MAVFVNCRRKSKLMKKTHIYICCLLLSFCCQRLPAQKFDEEFFRQHLLTTSYPLDTSADAIILYEKGEVQINKIGNTYNRVFHVHKIIKILRASAQSQGNISQYYRNSGDGRSFVRKIKATTYNLAGNEVVATSLDQNAVADDKLNKHYHLLKFAVPAVKAGSVIDYQYEIHGNLHTELSSWEFQSDLPKIKSEFEAVFPDKYELTEVNQKLHFKVYSRLSDAEADKSDAFKVITKSVGDKYYVYWCRNNMPALKEEPFISSIENHREFLDLQLSGFQTNDIISNWTQFDEDFMNDPKFGKQLYGDNDFLERLVKSLTKKEDADLKNAKSIFNYVRSNLDCSSFRHVVPDKDLEDILKNKRGTDAEINMLLIAMLKKAGITAAPVLLSKLGEMQATEKYPLLDRFNYLVCMATIDGEHYFLDATNKFNGFGTLPWYCYNGYSRIIDKEGSSVMLTAKNLVEKDFYKVNISRITDTSMNVAVTERIGVTDAPKLRYAITKDSLLLKKYVDKRVQMMSGDISILSYTTANLPDPDKDLEIRYNLKIKNNGTDVTYFTSDLIKFFKSNPFVAARRMLPIEFQHRNVYTYTLDMLLPAWLSPDDLPKPYSNKLNENAMTFDHFIAYDSLSRMLTVNTSFVVNETTYDVKDYEKIKSFFDKMIEEQNAMLVLKKNAK